MTRRERLEKRAEKRRDWAGSATAKADAAHERVHQIADGIPFGQPILVGHHSEGHARRDQARMESGMRTSVDESRKADRHEQVAGEIDRQLRTSVFSDDEDAVERLAEIVAELEEQRGRMKRYNALRRKRQDLEGIAEDAEAAGLTEEQTKSHLDTIRVQPYACKKGVFPAYALANLGATIRQKRQRIEQIERDRELVAAGERGRGRMMRSRYKGECGECGGEIERGETITWYRMTREAVHAECDRPLDGALVVSYGALSDVELAERAEGDVRQERRAARREIAHRESRAALYAEEEVADG